MNEQNVTIEITAEVKINGKLVPDASVVINSVVIDQIVIPNVSVN